MQVTLTGAKTIKAWQDGGSMIGGPKRAVWHTTENDPKDTTASNIADYLNRVGYQVHLVWNPVSGEIIQMIPADRAGRGLRNADGGVQTNREGDVCVQVEVVSYAAKPFTNGPMVGRERIVNWLRSLGIPDVWPDGPPPAVGHESSRSTTKWVKKSGHYSHSQVPENDHNDPGAIDIKKLLAASGDELPTPKDLWNWDGIEAPPWKVKENKYWTPASYLFWLYRNQAELADQMYDLQKKMDTVLAKLAA